MDSELKRKESEFRKELILKAAERVFGRKPYEEASLSEISNESGICLQSIYNLFGSKKDLYKSMILFRISNFRKNLNLALKEKRNELCQLKKWTAVFFETMGNYPQFFPVFLKEKFNFEWEMETPLFPELKKVFKEEEKRLVHLLRKAQAEKYFKSIPVQYLKLLFLSFVNSKMEYHLRHRKCFEVKKCVEEIFCDLLRGLKP